MRKTDEKWALFWCHLLHPVIFGEIEKCETNRYLKKLCEKEIVFPDGQHKKPSLPTLRRKLNRYKRTGFSSLSRKHRSDIGKPRKTGDEILRKAVELKKELPTRSHRVINRMLLHLYGKTIPRTTLYRHLKEAGATRVKLGISTTKVRKRWTRDKTNDLWIGDFEEGPYVIHNGESLPTHLSAFIDCHSRYIVEGRYYYRQSLDILMDSLIRAWSIHGKSTSIYVDNAKVYHSNALKSACYQLGIQLIHRKAGDPAPGGLIERFFSTCQSQFESEVRAGGILTIDQLNQAFTAWLNMAYHKESHSEIGLSPERQYEKGLGVIRHVDMDEAIRFFMKEVTRSVDKVFSDIRVDNCFYRVDPSLRGDRVRIRYDPYSDMQYILVYEMKNDRWIGKGIRHERQTGADPPAAPGKTIVRSSYLDLLIDAHEKSIDAQSSGIDFRKAVMRQRWPFSAFSRKLAALLGRKGELSAFSANDYEVLKKAYNRMPKLNASILTTAFERSRTESIAEILYECQQLIKERK
jgi:transposase InsO family protein